MLSICIQYQGFPPRPFLESLQRLAQNSTTIVAVGGVLSAISYAVWVVRGVQAKVEVLEEKLKTTEEKQKVTEERIKTATTELGGQIITATAELVGQIKTTEERIKTTEERIKTAKVEAIKESTENYMKYNHSKEFATLRKSNVHAGVNGAAVGSDKSE